MLGLGIGGLGEAVQGLSLQSAQEAAARLVGSDALGHPRHPLGAAAALGVPPQHVGGVARRADAALPLHLDLNTPAPPLPGVLPQDQIRTVFISGFPPDVRERELAGLLRFLPGYQAGQMNFKHDKGGQPQPQGFALFGTPSQALEAAARLNGCMFDPDGPYVLRCEMARKNMYMGMQDGEAHVRRGSRGMGAEYPLGPNGQYLGQGPYPTLKHPHGGRGSGGGGSSDENPPCNTLFVGNLGDSVTEVDLHQALGEIPGFRQLKLVRSGRNFTCFVEFADIALASAARGRLHGSTIPGCGRGGIRVQFSKNPFGKKRAGWEGGAGAMALPHGTMLPLSVLHPDNIEHGLDMTAPGLLPMSGGLHMPAHTHTHVHTLPGLNGE
jgi:hypothetical protein